MRHLQALATVHAGYHPETAAEKSQPRGGSTRRTLKTPCRRPTSRALYASSAQASTGQTPSVGMLELPLWELGAHTTMVLSVRLQSSATATTGSPGSTRASASIYSVLLHFCRRRGRPPARVADSVSLLKFWGREGEHHRGHAQPGVLRLGVPGKHTAVVCVFNMPDPTPEAEAGPAPAGQGADAGAARDARRQRDGPEDRQGREAPHISSANLSRPDQLIYDAARPAGPQAPPSAARRDARAPQGPRRAGLHRHPHAARPPRQARVRRDARSTLSTSRWWRRSMAIGNLSSRVLTALWKTDTLPRHAPPQAHAPTEDTRPPRRARSLDGARLLLCPEARSGELPTHDLAALWKQRRRWANGWDRGGVPLHTFYTQAAARSARAPRASSRPTAGRSRSAPGGRRGPRRRARSPSRGRSARANLPDPALVRLLPHLLRSDHLYWSSLFFDLANVEHASALAALAASRPPPTPSFSMACNAVSSLAPSLPWRPPPLAPPAVGAAAATCGAVLRRGTLGLRQSTTSIGTGTVGDWQLPAAPPRPPLAPPPPSPPPRPPLASYAPSLPPTRHPPTHPRHRRWRWYDPPCRQLGALAGPSRHRKAPLRARTCSTAADLPGLPAPAAATRLAPPEALAGPAAPAASPGFAASRARSPPVGSVWYLSVCRRHTPAQSTQSMVRSPGVSVLSRLFIFAQTSIRAAICAGHKLDGQEHTPGAPGSQPRW